MQAGGADVIELGVPFSDPIADGPVIQGANTVGSPTASKPLVEPPAILTSPDCCGARRRIFRLLGVRKASAEGRFDNSRSIYGWVLYSKPIPDCLFDGSLVPLLGYYNPLLAYGEKKAVRDAKEVGCNGFIMVDLPPEEAKDFRDLCASEGWGSASSRLQRKY